MKPLIVIVLAFLHHVCYSQNAIQTDAAVSTNKPDYSLLGSTYAEIEDVAWIEGHWKGEAFGGKTEEIWSAPDGNSMMGMFRLVSGGEISFYELMIIREIDKTLIMQLKHFHNTLKGWEEKDDTVDFPLVKVDENKVWFDGITFERTGENMMTVNVILEEDKPKGMDFNYYRK